MHKVTIVVVKEYQHTKTRIKETGISCVINFKNKA